MQVWREVGRTELELDGDGSRDGGWMDGGCVSWRCAGWNGGLAGSCGVA